MSISGQMSRTIPQEVNAGSWKARARLIPRAAIAKGGRPRLEPHDGRKLGRSPLPPLRPLAPHPPRRRRAAASGSRAFKFWTRHARRLVYRRIAFTGKETSSDTLNLFKGLGVTPREGCCERVLAHIHKVICSGDDAANDGTLKLMAWQIQNIGKPGRGSSSCGPSFIKPVMACCSMRRC